MKTASLLTEVEYNESKPMIKVLLETDFTKEIRIAMQKGTVMKDHKTPFPIVVELVEGTIDFGVLNEVKKLKKGDLIALNGGVVHNLSAQENSIVRLTLNKLDRVERVEKVVE